jgi:hypothetical protein
MNANYHATIETSTTFDTMHENHTATIETSTTFDTITHDCTRGLVCSFTKRYNAADITAVSKIEEGSSKDRHVSQINGY